MQDVQNLERQMQDGFAAEISRRQEDDSKMERAMTAKFQKRATSQRTATKGHDGWT